MNQLSLITVISILLIGLSCARNEDTLKDYTVAGEKTGIDTTAPMVASTNPTDGANTVVSSISATFSEVMDHSSINTSSFTLKDASKNSITGTVTSSDSGSATTSTFTPSSEFSRKVEYLATLTTGIKDLSGNSLLSQTNTSFTQPWSQQMGTSGRDKTWGSAIDSSNNVYISGFTEGSLDGNTNSGDFDLFLVKYDSSGSKQWNQQLGTSSFENVNGLGIDSSSNLFVVGYTESGLDGNTNAGDAGDDSYGRDAFLVKYNSSGTKQWTKQFGTNYDETSGGVAIDSSGNIFVTGSTGGGLDGNTYSGTTTSQCSRCQDLFLVKFNTSGTKQWTNQLGSAYADPPRGISVDSSDNIYIAGENWGGGLDGNSHAGGSWPDIYLVKYNNSGAKQWTKQIGTSSYESVNGIAIDSNDNIYVTGYTQGNLDGETNSYNSDMYLIKYNDSGNKQWTKLLGTGSSNGDEEGKAITIDSSNNIFITGTTTGTFSGNTNFGSIDMFLVKYNTSGSKQWIKQFGTSSSDYSTGIVIDASGYIYVSGYTGGSMDGNNSAGNYDMVIVKFDSNGTKQ